MQLGFVGEAFMFWDRVARVYDLFEGVYIGKVNRQLCIKIAKMIALNDHVRECKMPCAIAVITKK